MTTTTENLIVSGDLTVAGSLNGFSRSKIDLETGQEFPVNLTSFRVHDAFQTVLPNPSATDDLGMYGGTFGTDPPALKTYDVKTVGATNLYARALVQLPYNYVATESVTIRASAGMEGAVADTSCTLDLVAYKSSEDGQNIGADLVNVAAIDINSLTFADRNFTLTASTLAPGDILDIRFHVAVNDGAGASPVQAVIGAVKLVCDTRG